MTATTSLRDIPLDSAVCQINASLGAAEAQPIVQSFFDEVTNTASHVVSDARTRAAAIIDPVLDFDFASGRTGTASADKILAYVADKDLTVEWLLETHAHADHLSSAPYLQERLGGRTAIGRAITAVQDHFGALFNDRATLDRSAALFDHLFDDGDLFEIGDLKASVLHIPGHTPADLGYVIGNSVFCGDTLFMPDFGTARADFPGGDARQLYRSIRRLLCLPRETRLFLCHDYKASGRDQFCWETTIGAECDHNVHVRDGISEDAFVAMRTARDATLDMPKLVLPSIQVNMRGGRLPCPESNGTRYLKIPLNAF
ncbi:MBL fold metallo-hydrolase [Rhizorhabdus argentea]|uniref:MBL fold metallo-hydrolase n=1 Tax=Rhizorhabdus argentea TaxID=1387174 RepID=UPI0030ED7728